MGTELKKIIKEYPQEVIISSDVNKILTAKSKTIGYDPIFSTGEKANLRCKLKLKIIERSGNYLVHKDILRYHNSKRQGTVSTKTRSEVRGGGRKPWKQKGTGRARAGSNRSPLWKGGGVIFGPKSRLNNVKLNQKERKLSLQTLLYNKREQIVVIEDLENTLTQSKTKNFLKLCTDCKIDLKQKVLLVVSK